MASSVVQVMLAARDLKKSAVSIVEGGMADVDLRLRRMCLRWRRALHSASSPSSGATEKRFLNFLPNVALDLWKKGRKIVNLVRF